MSCWRWRLWRFAWADRWFGLRVEGWRRLAFGLFWLDVRRARYLCGYSNVRGEAALLVEKRGYPGLADEIRTELRAE